MLPEALVIFAFLNSTGCSETSSHYFNTHPEMKEMVEKHGKRIEEYLGPYVIGTVGPVLHVVSGGTGTVRLNRQFSLQVGIKKTTLMFGMEF